MAIEPLLSSALVRAILVALELALPLSGPLTLDVISEGSFEMAIEVIEENGSYTAYAVEPRRQSSAGETAADDATNRGELLFVAEPSDNYAHVYTLFSDPSAAAGTEGVATASQSDRRGSPGNAGSRAGAQQFPAAVDVGGAVAEIAGTGSARAGGSGTVAGSGSAGSGSGSAAGSGSSAGGDSSAANGSGAGSLTGTDTANGATSADSPASSFTVTRRGAVTYLQDRANGILLVVHSEI